MLGKSPSEKLDSDGKREYLSTPAKVLRHGGQKNAKGGGKSKSQKGHHTPSQNGRPKAWCLFFIRLHYCPLSMFETLPDTLSLKTGSLPLEPGRFLGQKSRDPGRTIRCAHHVGDRARLAIQLGFQAI